MTMTYNDLYLDARRALRQAGIEASSLEARELICVASGKSREEFFRDMPLYAPDFVQNKVEDLIARRIEGEPVAYLVGEWEFYGLTFTVNRHVLIPRPDTEVLAQRAIALMQGVGEGGRMLDLCSGTGCIGISVADQVPTCRTVLVDFSPEAVLLGKENLRRNKVGTRVTCFRGDARQAPDAALWQFDVIASNPPYIPTADIAELDESVRGFEPHLALDGGADGLDFYRDITTLWKAVLRPGGYLLFEVGIHQAEAVRDLMQAAGYEEVQVHPDSVGIPRVVEGRIPPT